MNTKIFESLKFIFYSKENYICKGEGIFIGATLNFNSPFFLNFDNKNNYNIAIAAPTGYGKTFLAKSIAYRAILNGIKVRVIDWNDEYSETLAKTINLKDFDEEKRIKIAKKEIQKIRREISKQKLRNFSEFIIIEEAWKVSKEVEQLAREARKKGYGIVAISQLSKDFEGIIENCATKIFFKNRGICEVDGVVVKVVGVDFNSFLNVCDKMQISKSKFVEILKKYYEQPQEILSKIQGNEIQLEELCKILLEKIGVDKTILFLREIGFKDIEISEAFSRVFS